MEIFVSSRNKKEKCFAKEAIIQGLAKDGGLFTPLDIEKRKIDIKKFMNLSYQEIAYIIFSTFFDDFSEQEMKEIIHRAYDKNFSVKDVVNLSKIGKSYMLELYHGPTAAFKDLALTVLPQLLKTAYKDENKKVYILTATSGDTGKAALEGFKNVENTFITVFYPNKGVSLIQEKQMKTTVGKNVEVIAINGNFDDCQSLVKKCYEQIKVEHVQLSSANSINIGRLVPQIVYYFKAYVDLVKNNEITLGEKVNFVVPTGNFGNILAGYFAKLLGCPIDKLICASNKNNILTDFIRTGIYDRNRAFHNTISPSMDILVSSNLERLLFILSDYDDEKVSKYMKELREEGRYIIDKELLEKIQQHFLAFCCDEENCKKTIKEAYEKDKRLIDPHTAIAYYASKQYEGEIKNVILSTASPYKFSNSVLEAINSEKRENEFVAMCELKKITAEEIPANLRLIEALPDLHNRSIDIEDGIKVVLERIEKLK